MKLFLSLLFAVCLLTVKAQKLSFPAKDITENNYTTAIGKLASAVIKIYTNSDKGTYYNNLFRFQFASQDYNAVIQSLDSFDVNSKMEKSYFKVSGFHYRVHSLAMLELQKDPS